MDAFEKSLREAHAVYLKNAKDKSSHWTVQLIDSAVATSLKEVIQAYIKYQKEDNDVAT